MKNYANRDAFEEAVIAGNTELAAVIQSFQHHQVGQCCRLVATSATSDRQSQSLLYVISGRRIGRKELI